MVSSRSSLLQYSLILVALITSLTPGSPNRLTVLSILAPTLKSWFPMGAPYLAKGSVVMCKSLLGIITYALTCLPFPLANVMWFWALNGYAQLDPFYGILLNFGCSFQSMVPNTHCGAYNQGLSASSICIAWKSFWRKVHMVSSPSSISFRCSLQQSQLLPWIFHSDAPFRCLIFPSSSLLSVMLTIMDLGLSFFKMNIPLPSPTNALLEIIYPPLHMRRKLWLFCTQYRSGGHPS